MTEEDNVLKINVHEDIKAKSGMVGSEALQEDPTARYYEAAMIYLQRYVPPHNKKSRWVTPDDLGRLLSEATILQGLCMFKRGIYAGIEALAHSQIDDKDPLRFFVLKTGFIVVNPVILTHTRFHQLNPEGCMSFPDEPMKQMVPRFNKIGVRYQTIGQKHDTKEKFLTPSATQQLNGGISRVFQHEVSHLNGCNIYDEDFAPEKAVGFGSDIIDMEELDKLFKVDKDTNV